MGKIQVLKTDEQWSQTKSRMIGHTIDDRGLWHTAHLCSPHTQDRKQKMTPIIGSKDSPDYDLYS